jgi:integrase
VFVGAYCGLRASELFGLRRHDVDLVAGTINVREILVEVEGKRHVGQPKTKAGRRIVPVPTVVARELQRHFDYFKIPRDGLVFSAPRGDYVRPSLWRRRIWQPACVAAGLGTLTKVGTKVSYDGLVLHELRHTAVAFWIAAKRDVYEIKLFGGHRSVQSIIDRYAHLLPNHGDAANSALDAIAEAGAAAYRAQREAEREADVIPLREVV